MCEHVFAAKQDAAQSRPLAGKQLAPVKEEAHTGAMAWGNVGAAPRSVTYLCPTPRRPSGRR